jgi:hypothetical protein
VSEPEVSVGSWWQWIPDSPHTTEEPFEVVSMGTITALICYKNDDASDPRTHRKVYLRHIQTEAYPEGSICPSARLAR